jgi:hypothetical protein
MGLIRKKKTFGIIDSEEDTEKINYCPRCLKFGFHHILQQRIYLPRQEIPRDHDLWKQCHECGTIVPIYEVNKESEIRDFVETTGNPFDSGKIITGLGNKKPKAKFANQMLYK